MCMEYNIYCDDKVTSSRILQCLNISTPYHYIIQSRLHQDVPHIIIALDSLCQCTCYSNIKCCLDAGIISI